MFEMARDKKKDDLLFNCSQEHEHSYVSGLYEEKEAVSSFLVRGCTNRRINNMTHKDLYKLIKEELGFSIPNS